MIRARDNRVTYRINSKHHYLVTMQRLNNTYYGNPRYEATIINLDNEDIYIASFVYRFTGHYYGDIDEAKQIVLHHEKVRGDLI